MREQAIVLTGAAGLIGRTLSTRLRTLGVRVVEVDINHSKHESRLDVCDQKGMAAVLEDVSGVIHLAAVSRVVHGEADPAKCWNVNVHGTQGLIELCLSARRRPGFSTPAAGRFTGSRTSFPSRKVARYGR